jgi:hypothetical protein
MLTYDETYKVPQRLKSGSTLNIAVNFTGVPIPTVSWILSDKPIPSMNVETNDNYSLLTLSGIAVNQTGQIKVKAENAVGSDTAEFNVIVQGF